eukprot:5259887-Karenia_brevis.AAC.1
MAQGVPWYIALIVDDVGRPNADTVWLLAVVAPEHIRPLKPNAGMSLPTIIEGISWPSGGL